MLMQILYTDCMTQNCLKIGKHVLEYIRWKFVWQLSEGFWCWKPRIHRKKKLFIPIFASLNVNNRIILNIQGKTVLTVSLFQNKKRNQETRLFSNRTTVFILFRWGMFHEKISVVRPQSLSRIMVCGAYSKKDKLPLLFIGSGVKIHQHFYIKHVLQEHLLQNAQNK
jgi:hypothetical protein